MKSKEEWASLAWLLFARTWPRALWATQLLLPSLSWVEGDTLLFVCLRSWLLSPFLKLLFNAWNDSLPKNSVKSFNFTGHERGYWNQASCWLTPLWVRKSATWACVHSWVWAHVRMCVLGGGGNPWRIQRELPGPWEGVSDGSFYVWTWPAWVLGLTVSEIGEVNSLW